MITGFISNSIQLISTWCWLSLLQCLRLSSRHKEDNFWAVFSSVVDEDEDEDEAENENDETNRSRERG